jgi:hypothetical protein
MSQQTKDFVRFLGLVAILYLGKLGCTPSRRPAGSLLIALGFDTTFTFLARGHYSFGKMNWILVKVFFGSGYLVRIDKLPASYCSPALTPQAVSFASSIKPIPSFYLPGPDPPLTLLQRLCEFAETLVIRASTDNHWAGHRRPSAYVREKCPSGSLTGYRFRRSWARP